VRPGRIVALLLLLASPASADPETSPITDSNYSIELYDGIPLGNVAVIGMGGATTAFAIGTAGTLYNVSAPAVRPTTDTDTWSWDYHIDYVTGSFSTDYDNNGYVLDTTARQVLTAGLGGRYENWALAVTFTGQDAPVDADFNGMPLEASTYRTQLALAKWIPEIDTAAGLSLDTAQFDFHPLPDTESLMNISGAGLELGAQWIPSGQDLRLGVALRSPIFGGDVTGCDPNDCVGWTLPEAIVTAPRFSAGAAYRFGPKAWNQLVKSYFRDERAVTLTTDVVVTGSTQNAFGLEAFGDHMLQRSGRHPAVSVRGGAEYEWKPGRLRLRGGSYWEPGRFVGVPGRLHVTFGIELRVFEFWFWGRARRGRISLTADLAKYFSNGGLSVGFWH
jgi:hypothetical protein